LRANRNIEPSTIEFIGKIIESNLSSITDSTQKFVVVKNWFGEIIKIDQVKFYEKFIEIAFENPEMLQELIKKIEE